MSQIKQSEIKVEQSPKNINTDLIHFKNDILKDVRTIKLSMLEKYSLLESNLNEKITQFDLTIKSFEQKILELSKLITIDKTIKEKVESLMEFKEETRDNIFKQRAKFNELENRVNKEINGINDILLDSVIYPGIIGGNAKFKTFHEFMDFIMREISEISLIKDKNGMDLRPFKRKIEQNIDAFRIQISNIYTKEMVNNAINKSEEKFQNSLKLFEEKIMSLKVENYNSNINYKNKLEELSSKIKSLEKNSPNQNGDNYLEIKYIKKEIKKIYEIIRDLLSSPEIKKEIEKKSKVYSGVKQYINGFLNADQLTSMKKFSYGKSNSNGKIGRNNSAKISPFPSEEKVKHNFERKKLFSNNIELNNEKGLENNNDNNSFKEKSSKDNFFISQKGNLINKVFSKDIKDNNNNEKKIINKKYEKEDKKNNNIINLGRNGVLDNINIDNRFKKTYKEEESVNNELNNENSNSNSKKLGNYIISEEDENILSDNTNFLKDKINKVINKNSHNNIPNNKSISFDVINKNKEKNYLSNNINDIPKNDSEGHLRVLNLSRENNIKIKNKNKNNFNSMKKLKEKEYNQSVPMLKITKEQEQISSNKENIGTQSNESQYNNFIKSKIFGNKTYTCFPHIKKENTIKEKNSKKLSGFEKNNIVKIKNNNSVLFNDENMQYNQLYYVKKPKKVLLINPDVISNYELRKKNKSANRQKSSNKTSNGFRTKKNLDKMVDEMIKGFVDKKKNRLITNGSGNYQTYNSLFDIINSYEMSYRQNQTSKNKK